MAKKEGTKLAWAGFFSLILSIYVLIKEFWEFPESTASAIGLSTINPVIGGASFLMNILVILFAFVVFGVSVYIIAKG